MKNNSTWETTAKPIVVLSVIALIVSLLLALINSFTAPVIEANNRAATLAAYVDVLPTVSDAKTLEAVDCAIENVNGVVRAQDGSVAVSAGAKGFDGAMITVIMGFDASGNVTGVYVDALSQTTGIGTHIADEGTKNQFVGINAGTSVAMGENGLNGVTGATFSSKALFEAVNVCFAAYNEVA